MLNGDKSAFLCNPKWELWAENWESFLVVASLNLRIRAKIQFIILGLYTKEIILGVFYSEFYGISTVFNTVLKITVAGHLPAEYDFELGNRK